MRQNQYSVSILFRSLLESPIDSETNGVKEMAIALREAMEILHWRGSQSLRKGCCCAFSEFHRASTEYGSVAAGKTQTLMLLDLVFVLRNLYLYTCVFVFDVLYLYLCILWLQRVRISCLWQNHRCSFWRNLKDARAAGQPDNTTDNTTELPARKLPELQLLLLLL